MQTDVKSSVKISPKTVVKFCKVFLISPFRVNYFPVPNAVNFSLFARAFSLSCFRANETCLAVAIFVPKNCFSTNEIAKNHFFRPFFVQKNVKSANFSKKITIFALNRKRIYVLFCNATFY